MSEINKAVERLTSLSEGNKSWAKHTATPQQAFDLREDAKAIDALLSELSRLRAENTTLTRERDEAREALEPFASVSAKAKGSDDACWCGQDGAVIRYRDLRLAERLARQSKEGGS